MKLFKRNKQKNKTELDMTKIIPVRNVKHEQDENGKIVLLKPKFSSNFSRKHIIPRMKYPYYKIHLDETGTEVWKAINGNNTAVEIGEYLEEKLGKKIEPVYERLGMFLATLKNEEFITW
ncbi:MAG: PqqD family protein [Fidelibacterota bacterium]